MIKAAFIGGICVGVCAGVVGCYVGLMYIFKDSFR